MRNLKSPKLESVVDRAGQIYYAIRALPNLLALKVLTVTRIAHGLRTRPAVGDT